MGSQVKSGLDLMIYAVCVCGGVSVCPEHLQWEWSKIQTLLLD